MLSFASGVDATCQVAAPSDETYKSDPVPVSVPCVDRNSLCGLTGEIAISARPPSLSPLLASNHVSPASVDFITLTLSIATYRLLKSDGSAIM